mgnify:CR=1 FL=1
MHRLILGALVVLAACARPEPPAPGLRDPDTQIASAALFDPVRFADVWHVAAAYGSEVLCGPLAETWVLSGPGRYEVTGTACGPNGARAFAGKAAMTGPGRIIREGLNGPEELWVLWVDQDFRVAVIGTPDGRFGRILSRTPKVRPDLLNAAREVLDFNGYDTSRLGLI